MSGFSGEDNGLRWTAFAALVVVAALAFVAGWMTPQRGADGPRDAKNPGSHERHAVLNGPAGGGAVTPR